MLNKKISLFLFIISFCFGISAVYAQQHNGVVFIDKNGNGIYDAGEQTVEGVCISNGKDVVQTGADGRWQLSGKNPKHIFMIKPSGYSTTLNQDNIPQYFYLEENGFPTGEINFPLYPAEEKNEFSVLFFGDTQARGMKEVNYILHDVVEECMGTDAAFGVSLGDHVADDPDLFAEISQGIGQIGIPWYYIFGNHDYDRDEKLNEKRDKTFRKFFGPSTYAFEYGKVSFIGFNDVFFNEAGRYRAHLTDEQLEFIENYISFVPEDKLVVLMMHIPVFKIDTQDKLFEILQNRKYMFSISGHEHEQMNVFAENEIVNSEKGWKKTVKHHHLVNGTVSGSWWCGLDDETGIPHATMNDGTPNGYSIITFRGNRYKIRYKAARRPADYQMNIYLPDEVQQQVADTTSVLVNVFAGSERSRVEMTIGKTGVWIPMTKTDTIDPECLRMHELSPVLDEKIDGVLLEDIFGYKMDYPSISTHMWKGKLPENLKPGTHTLTIRTTDKYMQTWTDHRIFRIKE